MTGSRLHSNLLQESAKDIGLPAAWGDPSAIPAYGGALATAAWKKLGLKTRQGVGGIPCELLHREVGSSLGLTSSCTANASLRMFKGFTEALAIYLPVGYISMPMFTSLIESIFIGAFSSCFIDTSSNPPTTASFIRDMFRGSPQRNLPFVFYWVILVHSLLRTDIGSR